MFLGEELIRRYNSDYQQIVDRLKFKGPNGIMIQEDVVPTPTSTSVPRVMPFERLENSAIMERPDESYFESRDPSRNNSKVVKRPTFLLNGLALNENDENNNVLSPNRKMSQKGQRASHFKNSGKEEKLDFDIMELEKAVTELVRKQSSDDYSDNYSSEDEHYQVIKRQERERRREEVQQEKLRLEQKKKEEEEKRKREEERRRYEDRRKVDERGNDEGRRREEEKRRQEERRREEERLGGGGAEIKRRREEKA